MALLPFDTQDDTERCLELLKRSSDPSVKAAALGQLLSSLNMKALDQGLPVQLLIDQLLEAWEQWENREDLAP